MKKIFAFTLFAALFAAIISCSSSSNTPSGVVEVLVKSMKSGDYKAVGSIIYTDGSEEAAQMKVAIVSMLEDKGAKTIEEMGGIKSYEITNEEISEDGESAEVTVNLVYGNGETKEDSYDTINKDGQWYLEVSK